VREFFLHCRAGDTAKVALELRCGADPNAFDATLTTALHVAAANGHEAVVRLLVSSGARLEARDKNMATPLLAAVKKGE
jgi:ankyrin repeat protein